MLGQARCSVLLYLIYHTIVADLFLLLDVLLYKTENLRYIPGVSSIKNVALMTLEALFVIRSAWNCHLLLGAGPHSPVQ